MLRVGYPATLAAELFSRFPREVELIPLSDQLDHDVEIDVWIPDPYPTRALRIWPHLRGVRLILSLMTGTEWIPGVAGPHVTICNAHGAHSISTAEWTLSAILAMLKYHPLYHEIQKAGVWKRRFEANAYYGAIGKEIERMLSPFNVNMVRIARHARTEPLVHPVGELDSLLPHAEVIVLILPATAESIQLIGPRQFALMSQGTLLVNAARGPIVDTNALVDALHSGRIRAALDVTDPEPLPEGHPLWSCPNLLLTPHVAGSSPQFAPRAVNVAADELRRYIAGEPLKNAVQIAI